MTNYRTSKPDGNQAAIIEELIANGLDVDNVSSLKRLYDIIASGVATWSNGHAVAVRVEIKIDDKADLTPDEAAYWARQRHGGNLIKATCAEQVLAWFGK